MLPVAVEMNGPTTNLLSVPFFNEVPGDIPIERLSSLLHKEAKNALACAPWKAYPYQPEVSYVMAHNNECIFLKFYVAEQFVAAAYGATNAPVYEDSCVEFFISFDETGYYNFEFNCIGACLASFGSTRGNRGLLTEESIGKIRSQAVVTRNGGEEAVRWTITLAIPLAAFEFHSLASLSGVRCRANFYKCGDGLPAPHYLTWSEVESPEPDFHLPQFFGTVAFQ
jgi:hypothetical protein